uniref:Uncharacterized protein n=1 Tax=Anguilla anguilla TaxID=7936 RepID=A0A0E9WDB6_ANGAN
MSLMPTSPVLWHNLGPVECLWMVSVTFRCPVASKNTLAAEIYTQPLHTNKWRLQTQEGRQVEQYLSNCGKTASHPKSISILDTVLPVFRGQPAILEQPRQNTNHSNTHTFISSA